jgi:hypothetical protein
MPSIYSDFLQTVRSQRPKLEVDLNLDGNYEDYTSFLDHFTINQRLGSGIAGLFDSQLDAELYIPNPSTLWAKPGLPVRATIQISSDKWVSTQTETLFIGTTEKQKTVPQTRIKITATSYLNNYLDRSVPRRVWINTDIYTIIDNILTDCGVPLINKSIGTSGKLISYVTNSSQPARVFIQELLTANLAVAGFDRDNVFRIRSALPLLFSGGSYSPVATYSRSLIEEYEAQDLASSYYANTIKVNGEDVGYLTNSLLYFDAQISSQQIKPQGRLYFQVALENIRVANLYPAVSGNPGPTINITGTLVQNSFLAAYTSDDGSGNINTANLLIEEFFVSSGDEGKDYVNIVLYNNSSSISLWLKSVYLYGSGLKTLGEVKIERRNDSQIVTDGQRIEIEFTSRAVQGKAAAEDLASLAQLNLVSYPDVFKINARAQPKTQVGEIIEIVDRGGATRTCVVVETDTEIQNGYIQTVIAKRLRTDLSYFTWDVDVWDDKPFL